MIARSRAAFTLLELLVVIAIIAILTGLLLSAVQQIRGRAMQAKCSHQLRQIALGMHQYHDSHHRFPKGHRSRRDADGLPYSGWTLSLLPYIEQNALYTEALASFKTSRNPLRPPHPHLATVVPQWLCPADSRIAQAQITPRSKIIVAFTSYLGVSGRDYSTKDGILFQNSAVSMSDITDGTSNTLLLGERPPSADFQFGWWYAGIGQRRTGSADMILGVREQNLLPIVSGSSCGSGAYSFRPSRFDDPCGMFHFWSPHSEGANFALADGSVRFLPYSSVSIMPDLSTRSGGEATPLP